MTYPCASLILVLHLGIADLPAGWRPWRILYNPGHYAAHVPSIRTWLDGRAPAMEP